MNTSTTTLQVPMSKKLKENASKVADEYGFSSLQEVIRLFLTKLAKKQIVVNIDETAIPLSWKNEKRYLKMDEVFAKGKNVFSASSVEELMKQLHS